MIISSYHRLQDSEPYVVVYHGDDDNYLVGMGRSGVGKALLDILLDRHGRGCFMDADTSQELLEREEAKHNTLREQRRVLEDERDALASSGVVTPETMEILDGKIREAKIRVAQNFRAVSKFRNDTVINAYLANLVQEAKEGSVDVTADVPNHVRETVFTERAKDISVGSFLHGFLSSEEIATVHEPSVSYTS